MKEIGYIVAVVCIALTLAGCVSTATSRSEWLPSISEPLQFDPGVLRDIPVPGITNAPTVWVRNLDLDSDGREDSVVTVKAPRELGPYWINYKSVTYVFRGTETGAFSNYRTAIPWFFVVTHEEQMHVRYGDSQTRRLFSLAEQKREWTVTVTQYEYGNEGGESRDRLMSQRKTSTATFPIGELSNQGLHFIGTFRAEK